MPTSTPDLSPESVATPFSGLPVYCPICQKVPLQGKQTVCSPRCRIQKSMARRVSERRERDAKIRLLLKTMIDSTQEALELLKPESGQRV